MHIAQLTGSLTDANLDELCRRLHAIQASSSPVIDLANIVFAHPAALITILCYIKYWRSQGKQIRIIDPTIPDGFA